MRTSRCKISNFYLADVNTKTTNVQVVYKHNVDSSTHCSEVTRSHVSKSSAIPLRRHHLMRYWIKPRVSKRNYWNSAGNIALQSDYVPTRERKQLLKYSCLKKFHDKNSSNYALWHAINKTLHVKRTQYKTFRDATPLCRFCTRFFLFLAEKMYLSFIWNVPAFPTRIPKGAHMSRVTNTLCSHFDASRHRNKFYIRVDDVMCIRNFILEYCT